MISRNPDIIDNVLFLFQYFPDPLLLFSTRQAELRSINLFRPSLYTVPLIVDGAIMLVEFLFTLSVKWKNYQLIINGVVILFE